MGGPTGTFRFDDIVEAIPAAARAAMDHLAAEKEKRVESRAITEEVVIVKVDQGRDNRVWLHANRKNGERIVIALIDHYPFMYVSEDASVVHPSVVNVEGGFKSIYGPPLKRITVKSPLDVRDLRTLFDEVHEADIPYTQRVIIDTECLGLCRVKMVHVRDNEYATKAEHIEHLSYEVKDPLSVVYYDIEVASTGPEMPGIDGKARDPIIAITIYDRARDDWLVWNYHPMNPLTGTRPVSTNTLGEIAIEQRGFADERKMMADFCAWFRERQPDVMAGWYSNGFDAPYIIRRLEALGLGRRSLGERGYVAADKWSLNWPGTQLLDLLDVRKRTSFGQLRNNRLITVAKDLCGIELEKNPGSIMKWWRDDLPSLIEYNVRDVEATWRVDEKGRYSAFATSFMFFTYVDAISDIFAASIIHDVYALRKSRGRYALPMKPPKPEHGRKKKKGFKGAVVQKPIPGLHRNVAVFDFSSLYPACMVAGNISPETYCRDPLCPRDHCRIPIDGDVVHYFHTDALGLVPEVMLDVWDKKRYYDRAKKAAATPEEKEHVESLRNPVKITLNAGYGVNGYEGARMYAKPAAEGTTAFGRNVITRVTEYAKKERGLKVVYGDTDSLACVIPEGEDPAEYGNKLVAEFNKVAQDFARAIGSHKPELFVVNFEKVYSSLIVAPVKKRYAGLVAWDEGKTLEPPKFSAAGFELKRSDTPEISIRMQTEILSDLLSGKDTVDGVGRRVNALYAEVRAGQYPVGDVAPMPKITKDFDDYESNHYAVAAAQYSNQHFGTAFRQDDRLLVVYVKAVPTGKPKTHVIALTEGMDVPEGFLVDWEQHAELAVRKKMETIMEALGASASLKGLGNMKLTDYL